MEKMNNPMVRKTWLRITIIVLMGIPFKFLLDVIFSLLYRNYTLFQPGASYLYTVLLSFFAFVTLLLISRNLDRKYPWEAGFYRRFFLQLLVNVGTALIFATGIRWLYIILFLHFTYARLLDELIYAGFAAFMAINILLVQMSYFLLERWRLSLAEVERFRKENAEVRFETLRSQVNPHFLFNSLNTLSSLIYRDQDKAGTFVRELSDVYRYILDKRDTELITLNEELVFVRSYINLLRLRFEENIQITLDIPDHLLQRSIAPITLQLLIENAVKHNVVSKRSPLSVKIWTENDEYLVISNNLQEKETAAPSSGMGLDNIRKRYIYLTNKMLNIIKEDETFTVKVPLI
ncbi:MAG: histidine kinase [Bacteroidetes bacterium]|nr:histidine kinase [Bacteroidota bacterium]